LADVIFKHENIPWHLAPAGQTSCDYGSPATQNQCETAVAAVASMDGRIPGRGILIGSGGSCNDGAWGSIPLGCSAQIGGDWAAHYKTSGANCNPGRYSLVCSGAKSVLDLVGILGNIRKVRVQLEGTNYLHMREIQVFDKNGLNVALNKVANQSGTTFWGVAGPASDAVNGDVTDFGSFSGYQAGK
jgi:hypothetical protein